MHAADEDETGSGGPLQLFGLGFLTLFLELALIRFLAGSHKMGHLEHITMTDDGPCTPHLPTDEYKLEDTVAVPAKAGDIVLFCIDTIHGSYINQTKKPRRLVRVGYRDPQNRQLFGQSHGRPGLMVAGYRERVEGDELFSNAGPVPEQATVAA